MENKPRSSVKFLCGLLGLALMAGCGGESTSNQPEGTAQVDTTVQGTPVPAVTVREIPYDPGAVYVERMYATTTGGSGVENVLDSDPTTYWEARPGAGVDEGIMLYFAEPVKMGDVTVIPGPESGIKAITLYANGSRMETAAPGQAMEIDAAVEALFFRIAGMTGAKTHFYRIDYGNGQVVAHDPQQKAQIAELQFSDHYGNPLKIRPLHLVGGKVSASTVLEPEEAYNADFLFDSRKEFGWAEGNENDGVGEELIFKFSQPVRIKKLKIWNGYQRSDKHFSSNGRVKKIGFGMPGKPTTHELPNQAEPVEIDLGETQEGSQFSLRVDEIYPGKSYKDLVLSEIRFYDGQRWFGMYTEPIDLTKDPGFEGSIIQGLFDRNLNDEWHVSDVMTGGVLRRRKLILRSNQSFVLYMNTGESDSDGSTEREEIADGNWEEVEGEYGKAERIKIFGKLNKVMDRQTFYSGNFKSDRTTIFHEFLTITPDFVYGEKLLDSIRTGPLGSDMVHCGLVADPVIDLKYKTKDNFMKEQLYDYCQECLMRRAVAEALGKAEELLKKKDPDYKFHIWDAYRPYSVQKLMWEKIKDPQYVADPYNGGSSHNKGAAIDLTVERNGELLDMGTEFDHFGEEAHHGYTELSAEVLANRKMLREVMEAAGFKAFQSEWWHYNFAGQKFPIADLEPEPCEP